MILMGQELSNIKRVYFISDAHLRIFDGDPKMEEKLLQVFDEAKASGSHLYIVGDLFDFWFEYKFAVPAAYLKVVAALLDLTRSGVKVIYIPGNHDFWMKDYLQREAGIELAHPKGKGRAGEGIEAEHFGKHIYITHGDGLRRDDYGYRFIKWLFRNKLCIWLYSQLPVNVAYRLAMRSSKASRDYTTNRKKSDPSDYIDFARKKVTDGFDAVVMGHVHLPQIEDFGQGLYINCGDFFEHFSYVVLDEGGFKMCRKNQT
jgi:UDP-2,3-diacylglucosamine hydrolase